MAIYPYKAAEAPFSYLEDHLLPEQGLHFRMPYIPSLLSLKVFPHPPGEIPSRFPFSFPLRWIVFFKGGIRSGCAEGL